MPIEHSLRLPEAIPAASTLRETNPDGQADA